MPRLLRAAPRIGCLLALTSLLACGGGGGGDITPPPPPPPPVVTSVEPQGTGQTARIGQAIPTAPSVIVKDQTGKTMAGVAVSFAVSAGGGTLGGTSATTNASGVATLPMWTLGATPGGNTVTATAAGGTNPSTQITATARPPRWTVLVYMAADNNLAPSGIQDIDEMEAAVPIRKCRSSCRRSSTPRASSRPGGRPPPCICRTTTLCATPLAD